MVLVQVSIIIFIILSAIITHEYAHGWVANKLGDPTAKLAGRLSLNPVRHIDPFGTIILPGILIALQMMGLNTIVFGWAKPVPVNFLRLHNPKRDMIWVALAGPFINIVLAVLFSLLVRIPLSQMMYEMVQLAVFINLLLAVFNMFPVPPLDGSRLVMGLLPNPYARQYAKLEPYGIPIVFGLLFLGLFEKIILPIIVKFEVFLGVRV